MKFINKILVLTALILGFSACDVTELDLQENPNAVSPENAGVDFLYNNLLLSFGGFYNGTHNFTGRTVRQTAMSNGNTYNNAYQAVSFNGIWYNAYAGLFPDVDALLTLTDEKGLAIHGGSAKVMKAYVMLTLVDMFGDVPYSEALQGTDIISPKADPGADVYAAAITLLDDAIRDLDGSTAAAPANDIIFGGDPAKWIATANSLKMKAYLNTGNGSGFKSIVDGGNFLDGTTGDFALPYGNSRSNPNSRHPWYNDSYEASDGAYQSNYFMWLLDGEKSMEDPRLNFYFYRQEFDMMTVDPNAWSCILTETPFEPVTTGWSSIITEPHWADSEWDLPYCIGSDDGYAGRDHGNGSGIPPDGAIRAVYGLYPAGGNFDDGLFEFTQNEGTDGALGEGINPVMLAAYVDFMRAEAALTLGTGEDARALLESGIRASIEKVRTFESFLDPNKEVGTDIDGNPILLGAKFLDPLDDAVEAYVALVLDRYDTATNDDDRLNTIITEYYIALYGNGVEAYNAYRRTSFPKGIQPGIEPGIGTFPNSALYPADYVNLNANAAQKADLSVKVFWAESASPSGSLY